MAAPRQLEYRWVPQECPICRVPAVKRLGRRGGAAHRQGLGITCTIWQCKKCSLIFPHPMPIPPNPATDHYEVDPDDFFRHHDPQGKLVIADRLLNEAEQLSGSRRGRLLDVGCGRGELLKKARERGWHVVGIEPSAPFAERAESQSGAEILRLPVEKCNLEAKSFDVVILAAVLEHLYNPDEVVAEIARLLRPGGLLFIDVPNERGLYFRIGNAYQRLRGRDWVVNLAPTFEPFHLFGFSPKSLRALLKKHDFDIGRWRVFGGVSLVPAHGTLISRIERRAAEIVSRISDVTRTGSYIEAWAVRR